MCVSARLRRYDKPKQINLLYIFYFFCPHFFLFVGDEQFSVLISLLIRGKAKVLYFNSGFARFFCKAFNLLVALDPPNPFAGNAKELPKNSITYFGIYYNRIYTKDNMSKSIYSKEYKNTIEKLKKARIEIGLKQEEVATKLKKPQSYISKIERGERRIDIVELQNLAKIYEKEINYFI